jgi:hypothetical protein
MSILLPAPFRGEESVDSVYRVKMVFFDEYNHMARGNLIMEFLPTGIAFAEKDSRYGVLNAMRKVKFPQKIQFVIEQAVSTLHLFFLKLLEGWSGF